MSGRGEEEGDGGGVPEAKVSKKIHALKRVTLWHILPRSPDLNPVERYWSYLRRRLKAMDLADMKQKRPAIDRAGLQKRVRKLLKTNKSKRVAQNMFNSFRKVCVQVKASGGSAYRAKK